MGTEPMEHEASVRELRRQLSFARTMLAKWEAKYAAGKEERLNRITDLEQRIENLLTNSEGDAK